MIMFIVHSIYQLICIYIFYVIYDMNSSRYDENDLTCDYYKRYSYYNAPLTVTVRLFPTMLLIPLTAIIINNEEFSSIYLTMSIITLIWSIWVSVISVVRDRHYDLSISIRYMEKNITLIIKRHTICLKNIILLHFQS